MDLECWCIKNMKQITGRSVFCKVHNHVETFTSKHQQWRANALFSIVIDEKIWQERIIFETCCRKRNPLSRLLCRRRHKNFHMPCFVAVSAKQANTTRIKIVRSKLHISTIPIMRTRIVLWFNFLNTHLCICKCAHENWSCVVPKSPIQVM